MINYFKKWNFNFVLYEVTGQSRALRHLKSSIFLPVYDINLVNRITNEVKLLTELFLYTK